MKSISMSKEAWEGISADAAAFTIEDEQHWFDTKDIQCQPAVIATLKGLRAACPLTALAVKDEDGETITVTELDISDGETLVVKAVRTPVYSTYPVTWASAAGTKLKVEALDSNGDYALITPLVANTDAVTITATGSTGVTGTVSIKPVA